MRVAPLLLLSALTGLACDRKADELPEWRPEDHDHQLEGQANQADPGAAPPAEAPRPQKPPMAMFQKFGIDETILAAWKTNCVPCHGLIGRGDGPQGAIMRPRNFADAEWQRVALDDEIVRTIKSGRGRMPAFPQLPDSTVTGLVRFIRLMNPERPPEPEGAPAGEAPQGTAPSGSSPHGTAPGTSPHGTGSPTAPSPHPAGSTGSPGAVAPGPSLPKASGVKPPGHP